MLSNSLYLKLIALFLGVILLTQCSKATETNSTATKSNSPYAMPADVYLALASKQTGREKQALLIMAAGRLIDDGQWQTGQNILTQLDDLSADLAKEKTLLLAKVDLMRAQPRAAITKIASVRNINSMPIYYQAQFHEILALGYQATGNAAESVAERIKLETLLTDNVSRAANLRALWAGLTALPVAELNTMAVEAEEDSELEGWMQLALIARKDHVDERAKAAAIAQWHALYPQHPANNILALLKPDAELDNNEEASRHEYTGAVAAPKHMAMLLPLTGPLAGPGGAVRDGFVAAQHAATPAHAEKVRLYNTHAANVAELYNQAIDEGADYIVGPLSKADVATVAAMDHPVPTLLLNELNSNTHENVYQFGLSPANEASQVATKARTDGHARVLIIAPAGQWGDEVVAVFTSQWQQQGGQVADTLHYRANEDFNVAVRNVLHLSDSEARAKKLQQLLGQNLQTTPRRRQDFDMIFLLAYPTKARQIMPMLKYHYAGDVPVYATSSVYTGNANARKDRDLNGIIFCDMPWVFAHQTGNKNWPEQFNSYNRLYALGMDSYSLALQLNELLRYPSRGVHNKSGVLYLNPNKQVARVLDWGQFRQGLAQLTHDNRTG